ncbi:MAG: LysR family transcriptional regulator [Marinosulfonomonas sp.]
MPSASNQMNLDFNALRTLRTVYRLGSFSAAADEIEVKQSTVSYTINRLRKAFDDPLIVRQGGKNVPTERCQQLIPIIDRILAEVEHAENQGEFNPSSAKGRVTMACSTYAVRVILPDLIRRLQKEAPGIFLNVVARFQGTSQLLLEGKADIALVFADIEENGIYAHAPIFEDYAVCIMDPGNPLVGKVLSDEDIGSAKHVVARLWANWKPPYVAAAEKRGIQINFVAAVSDATHIPLWVKGTDLIGGMPSTLAQTFGNEIGVARFPFHAPARLNMYWPAASNHSPLNSWLRKIIIEEIEKIEEPSSI